MKLCLCLLGLAVLSGLIQVEACSFQYYGQSGTIKSPNYPGKYQNSLNCVYDIYRSEWETTMITFNDLELESCCDKVLISNQSAQVGLYTGSNLPDVIYVQGHVRINFLTDGSIVKRGFKLEFIVLNRHKHTLSGIRGTISSPNFPNNYFNNLRKEYTITGRSNYKTELKFLQFDLENCTVCSLCDHLTVYRGANADSGVQLGIFCGKVLPPSMTIRGPVTLLFKTDRHTTEPGFRVHYRILKECGRIYNDLRGTISSPNHPQNYENNMDCDYVIKGRSGLTTVLRFIEFDMEANNGCHYDSLTIYHGSSSKVGQPIDIYCGQKLPSVVSHDGPITLRFRTNQYNVRRGFKATYEVKACDVEHRDLNGVIVSLNYPQSYENNTNCKYIIRGLVGHTTTLIFEHFRLEDSQSCSRDNFTVYAGQGTGGRVLGTFCGPRMPPQLHHIGPMTIVFQSDASGTDTGYRFRYSVECKIIFNERTGIITSPGHPNNYANKLACTYEVIGGANTIVFVTFESFDLENRDGFCYDSLTVKAGRKSEHGKVLETFCGNNLPDPIRNPEAMTMFFQTDKLYQREGFRARYEVFTACGGTYNQTTGPIMSPNYPGNYPSKQNCEYHFPGKTGKTTTLLFLDFQLEYTQGCTADKLLIYRGNSSASGTLLYRYCGSISRQTLSFTRPITMVFRTNRSTSSRGFYIVYTVS